MTLPAARWACLVALAVCPTVPGHAQAPASSSTPADPRVGLKPGFRDAGEAARNMQRVATLPKPEGFFDPKAPAGPVTPPEQPVPPDGTPAAAERDNTETPPADPNAPPGAPGAQPNRNPAILFANSDLAFSGDLMFVGNFNGFTVYNIENGSKPKLLSSVVCPGGQGDVSVYRNLLIVSVEQTRGRVDCGTGGVKETVSPERFRGIRIFDISDLRKPRQVAALQTCRGSHTHTLGTDARDRHNIYVYVSGTGVVRSADELAGWSGKDPKEDPNTSLFSIEVLPTPIEAP